MSEDRFRESEERRRRSGFYVRHRVLSRLRNVERRWRRHVELEFERVLAERDES